MAVGLFLFIRDEAGGDLVAWISAQLCNAHKGAAQGRLGRMREALIQPLDAIYSVGRKVLNMALADLLMAAPRTRRYWFETGASMVAIDTLVHNWMHRTGILPRFGAEHSYGPACYGPNGCQAIIERLARRIDARKCNPMYPKIFPRWVQHSIFAFCNEQHANICNGNRIDDTKRCRNRGCFLIDDLCDRVRLRE
jgi:hypothetical protein